MTTARFRHPAWFVPTLFAKDSDPPLLDTACTLVLAAFGDEDWQGGFYMSDEQQVELLREIDDSNPATKLMSSDATLSFGELTAWLDVEENRDYVKFLPSAVHGMLNQAMVEEAFRTFDDDGSGTLDTSEWDKFLDELAYLRLEYLLRRSLLNGRAFVGRRQPWRNMKFPDILHYAAAVEVAFRTQSTSEVDLDSEENPLVKKTSVVLGSPPTETFQVGYDESGRLLPPGWRSDLLYYSANNHPLHGMIACDPLSRLSRSEFAMLEVATVGFMICTGNLHESWVLEGRAPLECLSNPHMFSLAVVSIPGILVWQLLFFLFTCPICLIDESNSPLREKQKAQRYTRFGEMIGYVVMTIGVLGGLLLIQQEMHVQESHLTETVVTARLHGYVITWMLMLSLYFNPVVAWGQPDPKGGFCLGDYVGIGQWRIEKQQFQHRCVKALATWLESHPGEYPEGIMRKGALNNPLDIVAPSLVFPLDAFHIANGELAVETELTCDRTSYIDIETVSHPRSSGNKLFGVPDEKSQVGKCSMDDSSKCYQPATECATQCHSMGDEIFGAT